MNRSMLRAVLVAAFMLVALAALLAVRGHERTLAEGRVVLAELAPVDPRSLMQGDYMALRFAIDEELRLRAVDSAAMPLPRYAVLLLDAAGRATLAELSDVLPAPATDHVAVRIRHRDGGLSIGPNAFFFQEGAAERFGAARWGEFRVAPDGKALLTHLRDAEFNRLGDIVR
jgi:uncharacterized membrane-anchored protein